MELSAPPVVQEEEQPDMHLRSHLAAAVRSINWSYAIFWSISSCHPGNSMELTAEQLNLQRSEQLLELYKSLLSGRCDHRARRPVAVLSPEDLGSTEWYYVVCMTYAFRPGQGYALQLLDDRLHPSHGRVLELGTTALVPEDPELLTRATTYFKELKLPRCTESPSTNHAGEANNVIVLDDLDEESMEATIAEGHEIHEVDCLFPGNLEQITKGIDDFYGLWEELDAQPLQDSGCIMDDSFLMAVPEATNKDDATLNMHGDSSHGTSFISWTRIQSDEMAVPVIREPQKLLKKVVSGGAWTNNNGGQNTARTPQETGIKNHVMSERRRREKLNEMFLVLKSLVPTIHKMDKASILAETIAYLKELERRVNEMESRRETTSWPAKTRPRHKRRGDELKPFDTCH
ncbi:hypothetical protein EJB05_38433, partial [Eragrostis curvula]